MIRCRHIPIDLPPAAAWYKQVRYTQKAINSFSRNPFSGAQQIYTWGAGWWEVDVLLRPMRRDNATDWQSYLMSLHGKEGTFNFVDPVNGIIPRGVWGGTPVVWNPTAPNYYSGNAIWIGVYAPNQLNVVRVGDWFNIQNIGGLYQVTATSAKRQRERPRLDRVLAAASRARRLSWLAGQICQRGRRLPLER